MAFVKMAMVLLGLLAMTQQTMQLSFNSHLRIPGFEVVKGDGTSLGLISTSLSAEKALNDSGLFIRSTSVNLFGRMFSNGTIHGLNVVYVRTATIPSVHVGITMQILVDNFNIQGIVLYGSAGTTNDTISIGSVVVPSNYYVGAWDWMSEDSSIIGQLNIGDFNYPHEGKNLLGSLLYLDKLDVYNGGRQFEMPNDLFVSLPWINLAIAANIQIEGAEIFYGLHASSSDLYVKNPAYRKFLYEEFNVSIVDTTGAAFILGALSNNQGYIVFQGISNKAGAGLESNLTLANENAFSAVAQFIKYIATPAPSHSI